MYVEDPMHDPSWQQDLSRRAADRYRLLTAAEEARRPVPRPGAVRRFRHSLAGGLVATARLIDAT